MSDQETTISVDGPGGKAEQRNAWVARVLGLDVGRNSELKQDYGLDETRPPPTRPPPEPPTQTTGSQPPNRPLPPLPQKDPNRELFGRELIAVEGRLEYLRDAESSNEKVKAAQGDLTGAMAEMDKAAEEKRYSDARKHLGAAKGHADRVEKSLEEAGKSERDFLIDYQKIAHRRQPALDSRPPTEWTKKAKAEFTKADDVLQKHIENKAWTEAGTALITVVGKLDAFDSAAKLELESKLDLLDKWPEAQGESGTLRGELNKLTPPLLGNRGYPELSNSIRAATAGWRNVRVHKVEMDKLAAEFGCIAHIPDPTLKPVLRPQWDAYDKARAAAPDPSSITNTDNHEKLIDLREAYAKAGRALVKAWESGVAGAPGDDPYWKSVGQDWLKRNTIPLRQAYKVPPTTPEIAKRQQELRTLEAQRFGTWKEIAESQRNINEKCVALIALRTTEKDPALVELFAKYRKTEKDLKAAADGVPSTGASPEQQEYKRRYEAFILKLNGTDDDIVAVCGPELQWLIPKAETALGTATNALKNTGSNIKAMPAGNDTEKLAKAQQAVDTINSADPVILARLSTDEKLDLLDSLRAHGMPAFDRNNPGTRDEIPRQMMRKLYQAMTLEEEFAKEDEKNRKKVIEALKGKKQELKDAKENWSVMTDEQKVALLKVVAEEQCRQFGFTMPSNGIVVANEPGSSDNGSYAPSNLNKNPPADGLASDRIKINSSKPVLHDFEAALDLILHENTHRNQNVLCRALRYPTGASDPKFLTKDNSDPPYTQTRMFNMGNVPGGYVSGAEDYETYKKQPEEEHAWLAGPRGAQGIMDMLGEE
jgi:hypothetical protein